MWGWLRPRDQPVPRVGDSGVGIRNPPNDGKGQKTLSSGENRCWGACSLCCSRHEEMPMEIHRGHAVDTKKWILYRGKIDLRERHELAGLLCFQEVESSFKTREGKRAKKKKKKEEKRVWAHTIGKWRVLFPVSAESLGLCLSPRHLCTQVGRVTPATP